MVSFWPFIMLRLSSAAISLNDSGIMEWTHPLLTGLAMGHDEVVESHLERGWVHYEDYNHRFGYR
ncbi:hypothetical protein, partial [Shewanella algae]|uniref:hypothetical protein n=1 Tax=Shewanella algae TaxID=38313 RepID=UPI001AAD91CB